MFLKLMPRVSMVVAAAWRKRCAAPRAGAISARFKACRTILEIALESVSGRAGVTACRKIVLSDDDGRSRLMYASNACPTSRKSGRSRRDLVPRI
jgi:hypothetical protein